MAYTIDTFKDAQLIYAAHEGAVNLQELFEIRDEVVTRSRIEGIKNILVNLSSSVGNLEVDEHYKFANGFIEDFPHGVRFGVIVNNEFVSPERIEFMSKLNSTRGVIMYFCYDLMEALQWLNINPAVIRQD